MTATHETTTNAVHPDAELGDAVRRTLAEVHNPDGTRSLLYDSETHNIKVTTKTQVPNHATAAMLRKLAGWIEQTAAADVGDPWA